MMRSGVPGSLRRKLFREAKYVCEDCGIVGREVRCEKGSFVYPTTVEGTYLSIDHIVARANGGTSDVWNLRVICTRCNSKKGTKPMQACQ